MAINESGDKMYELSNHLGNVLNVVADRKLPVQLGSTGTVDYYVSNVMSYSDYYPFGMQLAGKKLIAGMDGSDPSHYVMAHGSSEDYRYGFNGYESDDEVYGEKNSYTTEFRQYDPRIGRWLTTDPIVHPWQSPYCAFDNNPVYFIDPDGTTVQGDYYGKNGKWLGSDGKNDDKVYRVDNAKYKTTTVKGKSSITGKEAVLKWKKEFDYTKSKSTELSIKHSEFVKQAATVYGESSYTYGVLSKEEMFAIASVHQKNGIAYGANNAGALQYKSFEKGNQNEGMQTANAAVMNAVTGGFDYSYGADQWDGAEQAMVPKANMDKASNGVFMYKMNTMGWSISDEHYQSWKKAVEGEFGAGKFTVPQKKSATQNYGGMTNKGKIRLKSTAQYGLTIFWKTN